MREGGERRGRRDIAGRTGLLFGVLFGGIFIARDVIESYPGGSAAGTDSLFALLAVLAVLCGPLAGGWAGGAASPRGGRCPFPRSPPPARCHRLPLRALAP